VKTLHALVGLFLWIASYQASASSDSKCGVTIVDEATALQVEFDWRSAPVVSGFWEKTAPALETAGLLKPKQKLQLNKAHIRRGEVKNPLEYAGLLKKMSEYRVGSIWLSTLAAFSEFLAGKDGSALAQALFLSWTNEGGGSRLGLFGPDHPRRRYGYDLVVGSMFLTPSQPIVDILDPLVKNEDLNKFEITLVTLFYQHLNNLTWSLRGKDIRRDFESQTLQAPLSHGLAATTLHYNGLRSELRNSLGTITVSWNGPEHDVRCIVVPGQWSDLIPEERRLARVTVDNTEVANLVKVEESQARALLHFMGTWEAHLNFYLRGGGIFDTTTEAVRFILGDPKDSD